MTSPSLKNHPTTAPRKATSSSQRTLWKQCLAGALCLLVAGAIPAADHEGDKPLERLKQRSARQRWRELRGEWVPAPDAVPTVPEGLPRVEAKPMAPINPPSAAPSLITKPVPETIDIEPETEGPVVARPGAKPGTDSLEPTPHPGSFAEIDPEQRVQIPRERAKLPLPHWPFTDDLDLVDQGLEEEMAPTVTETQEAGTPEAATSPAVDAAAPPRLTPPVQVAEVPSEVRSLAVEPVPVAEAEGKVEAKTKPQLKSIRDIQPFYNYASRGGEPNRILCPPPANADPQMEYGSCPQDEPLALQGSLERNAGMTPVSWHASNVTHNPLYFEDSGLERSGHSFSDVVQPFVSVGKFGAQVVALPYTIALDPMWKHESPLGHSRPGEYAPKRHLALPINGRAAATAAAAYTGIIFLIP